MGRSREGLVRKNETVLEERHEFDLPALLDVRRGWKSGAAHRAWPSAEGVLQGVAGGRTAGSDPQLAINRAEVRFDGQLAHNEFFGDLGIGESSCKQSQHLDLTRGQFLKTERRRPGSWS